MSEDEIENLINKLEGAFNNQLNDLRRDLEQRIDELEARIEFLTGGEV